MNKMFEFSKEDLSNTFDSCFNYETNPNYNKDLDMKYNLKISNKDKGTEKEIKVKREVLTCEKNCNKCKSIMDRTFNLFENECGQLEKKKTNVKIKIPREITDGQSILLIGEGKRKNNQFGNLLVTFKIR